MNELKQWFLDQSPRDQLMLSIGGAFVFAFILIFVVLFPMQDKLDKMEMRNQAALGEQQEVLTMAGDLLAQGGTSSSPNSSSSLNGLINSTTRKHNIRMESLQPSGDTARVRIGASEFNNVMAWLNEMENKRGMQIKDLSITASSAPGSVVVQLQLVQGG